MSIDIYCTPTLIFNNEMKLNTFEFKCCLSMFSYDYVDLNITKNIYRQSMNNFSTPFVIRIVYVL